MKHFMRFFLWLQILLFLYIFQSSVYNVYEKNHLQEPDLIGYQVEDVKPETLERLYQAIVSELPNARLQVIQSVVTATDQSVYDVYCYPLNQFSQQQPVSNSIGLVYRNLTRGDFGDSVGSFYSDIPEATMLKLADRVGTKIQPYKSELIGYDNIIRFNLLNLAILGSIILLIHAIYTSYSFKTVGIKKSLGFSTGRILWDQVKKIVRNFFIGYGIMIGFVIVYLLFRQRFSLSYVLLNGLFFSMVLATNVVCIYLTASLIGLVSFEAMIKNKTLNRWTNWAVQGIKLIFTGLIIVVVISLLKQQSDYQTSQQAVLDYQHLDGYYTANGFYSEDYELALKQPTKLQQYSDSILALYQSQQALLCDTSSLSSGRGQSGLQGRLIIANQAYLDEFSNIVWTNDGGSIALVPKQLQAQDQDVRDYLELEYQRLLNYNRISGLVQPDKVVPDFRIEYFDDASTVIVNTATGFQAVSGNMVIVDQGQFDGLYYLDALNNRGLFFELPSRTDFAQALAAHDLSALVAPGTLLTPFRLAVESVYFVLKTLVVFAIVFVVSLIFILYISNYVDIVVNRRHYALKLIMGFGHGRILRTRYLVWLGEIILGILLSLVNQYSIVLVAVVLVDMVFCEVIYRSYIRQSLSEIEKGA